MKKVFTLFGLLTIAFVSNAQVDTTKTPADTIWRKGGFASVTFNQVSLTNWAAGGDNSIGGNALLFLHANMKKGKWAWDNSLELAYGSAKTGKLDWRKSDDKIDLNTKVGRSLTDHIYLTYLLGFKSQFSEGFDYSNDSAKVLISNFMAPAYIINSIGFDWKPSDDVSIFISPLTAKTTIVKDQTLLDAAVLTGIPTFGVEPGKEVRNEIGAYFVGKAKKNIMENISLATKLELFSNYENNPQNIDVNWEVILAMKVNKLISVLLTTQLLYDDDIYIPKSDANQPPGPGTQFKETFGLGFSYKFEGYGVQK